MDIWNIFPLSIIRIYILRITLQGLRDQAICFDLKNDGCNIRVHHVSFKISKKASVTKCIWYRMPLVPVD